MLSHLKHLLVAHHDRIRWLLPDRHFAFRTASGRIYLNPRESMMMLERIFGFYEPEKFEALGSTLKPGSVFVDVGGNKGDFALYAARLVGKTGRVFCFEPEPANVQWIRRSAELNGYSHLCVYEAALADYDGRANLHLGAKSGFHTLLAGQPNRDLSTIEVDILRLDTALRDEKRIDVIKIDVEGAELEVLRGAQTTLRANPEVILLLDLHPKLGVNPKEVIQFLSSLRLDAYKLHSQNEILAKRGALPIGRMMLERCS
jgi:FkbM family methyltransferase